MSVEHLHSFGDKEMRTREVGATSSYIPPSEHQEQSFTKDHIPNTFEQEALRFGHAALFEAAGYPIGTLSDYGVKVALKSISSLNFDSSVHAGDNLITYTAVESIGNTSLTIFQLVDKVDPNSEKSIKVMSGSAVYVYLENGSKKTIPDSIRNGLKSFTLDVT